MDDGEAPAFADGVGPGKRDEVFDGEVESFEEVDEEGGIGSGAWHDVV